MNILEQLDHPGFKPSKSARTLMEYIRLHSDLFCTTPIASLAKKISNPSAPASILQLHRDATVIVDKEAASLLPDQVCDKICG